ncbi:MAG: DUF2927 domain-containing protein, partial [Planktotalea sp.]|uniref:DUF2927 domain-containing protein n=1 Tax=Planktotalea sp. TaxID=2029877 RepID=UPI003C74F1ED
MRRFLLPFYLALSGCVPSTPADMPSRAQTVAAGDSLPAVKVFNAPRPTPSLRANSDIARDFLELSFNLESGRSLQTLTRFEGPITVRVTGKPSFGLGSDLNRLLHRLRTEARIDIRQQQGESANITIEAVPRTEIRKLLPQAACFVAPNVSSIQQYRLARRTSLVNWTGLKERKTLSIFLPNDASPQEVRDCLHEELAQALGPLNDLYRLPDSVFNDDNVHTVLTGFDMLILRAYYDPSLRNGMSKSEVASRIGGILTRINPRGAQYAPRRLTRTPRTWINAIQRALGPGANQKERLSAANEAMQIAVAMGWSDHRRAFSHYAMGRLQMSSNLNKSREHFSIAARLYGQSPSTRLHAAYAASQLASFYIAEGNGEAALKQIGPHLDTAARYENAALLSTLMLQRAEALDLAGRSSEARTIRMDSLGWARYGFG